MSTAAGKSMRLTLEPDMVIRPETHYVFLEKTGPFQNTAPQAWQTVHPLVAKTSEHNRVTGYMSLFKIAPQIYRAGVSLAAPPQSLPEELLYEKLPGGKYSRFVLTGSYANLPEACGRAFQIVAERRFPVREDFNIENYVSDPRSVPEEQLITEILVPTA